MWIVVFYSLKYRRLDFFYRVGVRSAILVAAYQQATKEWRAEWRAEAFY